MKYSFVYQTSLGSITLTADERTLTECTYGAPNKGSVVLQTPVLEQAFGELQEYLSGKRAVFHVPLNPTGTLFQQKVWKALMKIPYGQTVSYKEIAKQIGNEKACRAVGMANNRNPIAIFIPCHRVVGANGKLVGYAGGLNIKKALLTLESSDKKESSF